jgi:predicted RNA-binding protein with PIN domain
MTLLIDGHNLLGTGLVPGVLLGDADDEWLLVQRLRAYAAAKRIKLTVVFDSGLGPAPQGQPSDNRVAVRFAPLGVEADTVIVQLLRANQRPGQVTVVTNDQGLAGQVRAAGGQVRSATQFAAQLAPRKAKTASTTELLPDPRDPGFADIYQGFVAVEKDQARYGAEIDLDATEWIERLYGDDVTEASRAARWLGRYGGAAGWEPLLDALSHRAGQVRSAALLALADLGDRRAVPAIVARLAQDDSGMAREAAAQALGRLGGAAAENALLAAQADPKAKVRKAAAASLAQMQARF